MKNTYILLPCLFTILCSFHSCKRSICLGLFELFFAIRWHGDQLASQVKDNSVTFHHTACVALHSACHSLIAELHRSITKQCALGTTITHLWICSQTGAATWVAGEIINFFYLWAGFMSELISSLISRLSWFPRILAVPGNILLLVLVLFHNGRCLSHIIWTLVLIFFLAFLHQSIIITSSVLSLCAVPATHPVHRTSYLPFACFQRGRILTIPTFLFALAMNRIVIGN